MFIRIKKRKSHNGIKKYAYLVKSQYHRKGPRQKIVKYLGRVNELKKIKSKKSKINIKKAQNLQDFLLQLLERELRNLGFRKKDDFLFIHSKTFVVDIKNNEVYSGNEKVVLPVNYGVLCNFTVKQIFEDIEHPDNIMKAEIIGKRLIAAGISVKKTEFITLYKLINKTSNPNWHQAAQSNDEQSQAMTSNPKHK